MPRDAQHLGHRVEQRLQVAKIDQHIGRHDKIVADRTLPQVLDDRLGSPLTTEKLARITVTDLKTGLGSLDGEEDGEDISVGLAPIKLAIFSPTRSGECHQFWFQPRINSVPHSCSTSWRMRSMVAFGSLPSELPSR